MNKFFLSLNCEPAYAGFLFYEPGLIANASHVLSLALFAGVLHLPCEAACPTRLLKADKIMPLTEYCSYLKVRLSINNPPQLPAYEN